MLAHLVYSQKGAVNMATTAQHNDCISWSREWGTNKQEHSVEGSASQAP